MRSDSRHCHGHGGDTHGVVLPHHNPPGPVPGRPRRNSVGVMHHRLCTALRVDAGGTGGISAHAHPSVMARP
eukprot:2825370-Prymnesium_polylepis.1